uniref:Uncharacterized protein n=1 Tax=Daphnia magna TaxID=35525 RepID=A0A0P5T8H7_9CRUS
MNWNTIMPKMPFCYSYSFITSCQFLSEKCTIMLSCKPLTITISTIFSSFPLNLSSGRILSCGLLYLK